MAQDSPPQTDSDPGVIRVRPAPVDWTAGAAKWAAVGILGLVATVGIARSLLSPGFRPTITAPSGASPPSDPAGSAAKGPSASAPAAPVSIAALIDLNTATQAELESLPGIGPALATRIIDDRTANGAYRTVEQLDRVRGIGPKLMEKLRPLVRVVPPAEEPANPR